MLTMITYLTILLLLKKKDVKVSKKLLLRMKFFSNRSEPDNDVAS